MGVMLFVFTELGAQSKERNSYLFHPAVPSRCMGDNLQLILSRRYLEGSGSRFQQVQRVLGDDTSQQWEGIPLLGSTYLLYKVFGICLHEEALMRKVTVGGLSCPPLPMSSSNVPSSHKGISFQLIFLRGNFPQQPALSTPPGLGNPAGLFLPLTPSVVTQILLLS